MQSKIMFDTHKCCVHLATFGYKDVGAIKCNHCTNMCINTGLMRKPAVNELKMQRTTCKMNKCHKNSQNNLSIIYDRFVDADRMVIVFNLAKMFEIIFLFWYAVVVLAFGEPFCLILGLLCKIKYLVFVEA